jgi:hypothetical protein
LFVPGNDYKAFLRSHLGENEFHRGEIYDVDGNFVAEHGGIEPSRSASAKDFRADRCGRVTLSI